MHFTMNITAVRACLNHVDFTNDGKLGPNATLVIGGLTVDQLCWMYCPNCLWFAIGNRRACVGREIPCCPRPTDEPNTYGFGYPNHDPCPSGITPTIFPDEIEQAMWSAVKIGGTNAVIEMTAELAAHDLGLPNQIICSQQRRAGIPPYPPHVIVFRP